MPNKVQSEEPMKTNWADDSPTSIGLVLGNVWVRLGLIKNIGCYNKTFLVKPAVQRCLLGDSLIRMLAVIHTI